MTSLHERIGLDFDPIDRAVEDTETDFVLGDKVSDVRTSDAQAALIDEVATTPEATLPAKSKDRFAFSRLVLNSVRGMFARSPQRPKREKKKHYPPRFSTEFETSLVDRERRRL